MEGSCGGGVGEGEESKEGGRRIVVVALDESEQSFYALKWALNTLLSPSPSPSPSPPHKLYLLHAKVPPTSRASLGGPEYMLSAEMIISMNMAQNREIQAFMNKALELCKEKQIIAETKVVAGDARDVLCEVTEKLNADFLVIGSHGYGAIKRAFLGSVSDYCAHHVKCPVIIVKKPHKEDTSKH